MARFPYDDYPAPLKDWIAANRRGPWVFQAYSLENEPHKRLLIEGVLVGPGLLLVLTRTPNIYARTSVTACLSVGGTGNTWASAIADLDRLVAEATHRKEP